jgi:hypothetical protein
MSGRSHLAVHLASAVEIRPPVIGGRAHTHTEVVLWRIGGHVDEDRAACRLVRRHRQHAGLPPTASGHVEDALAISLLGQLHAHHHNTYVCICQVISTQQLAALPGPSGPPPRAVAFGWGLPR